MEAKRAAAAALLRIGAIEREQVSVREQRQVDRVSGCVAGINLIIHDDAKLLVEEQVKHQHKAAAVGGNAGLVIDRLNNLCPNANIHEFRHSDGDAVDYLRGQFGVPVRVHAAGELGALNGIGKLRGFGGDARGGIMLVFESLEVGGVQRRHHEWSGV